MRVMFITQLGGESDERKETIDLRKGKRNE